MYHLILNLYPFRKHFIIFLFFFIFLYFTTYQVFCEAMILLTPDAELTFKNHLLETLLLISNTDIFLQKYGHDYLFYTTFLTENYIKFFVENLPLNDLYNNNHKNIETAHHIIQLFINDIAEHKNIFTHLPYNRKINEIQIINDILFSIKNFCPHITLSIDLNPITLKQVLNDLRVTCKICDIWNDNVYSLGQNNQALEILGIEDYIETKGYRALVFQKKLYATLHQSLHYVHFTFEDNSLIIYITYFLKITLKF